MKTKYILNSGGMTKVPNKTVKFIQEIIKDLGSNPKILFCFFAEKREDWEEKFEKYTKGFIDLGKLRIKPKFELAFPDKFEEQIKENDAIYIHGGDDILLQYWLKQFDLSNIWKGKIIATNSASSDVMANHFWAIDWRKNMDGLGILPIKFIAHYKSKWGEDLPQGPIDWEKAKKELENYGDKSLPIYALEEGDYVVFEM